MKNFGNKPTLIITYLRPLGVIDILNTLEKQGPRLVYIAIDGPKNFEDERTQQRYNEIINSFTKNGILTFKIWHRSANLGIGASIISAIDWFFSNEASGIIIEDDLIISKDFLKFVEAGLDFFARDNNVFLISGSQFDSDLEDVTSLFWTNYPIIWGWGTWDIKWKEMRKLILKKKRIFPLIYLPSVNFFRIGALRTLNGLIDTWDLPLAFEMRKKRAHCVLPPVNLVSNVGTDNLAEHTKKVEHPLHLPIRRLDQGLCWNYNGRSQKVRRINKSLEKKVFKIKRKHIFLPLYAYIQDSKNKKNTGKEIKLLNKLKLITIPSPSKIL